MNLIKLSLIEKSPNFNFILFRSAYKDYNWYNNELNNEKISNINLKLSYKELIVLTGDYNLIDNYTFFRESTNALTGEIDIKRLAVNQINIKLNIQVLNYLVKLILVNLVLSILLNIRKKTNLGLEDYLLLNVPEWITRNTIMYSNDIFNNSLFIQTGITFNYFTKYYADYYNPLLSEFVTQNYQRNRRFSKI